MSWGNSEWGKIGHPLMKCTPQCVDKVFWSSAWRGWGGEGDGGMNTLGTKAWMNRWINEC